MKAKVNLIAVRAFRQTVEEAQGYSPQFDKGIISIEQFGKKIKALRTKLKDDVSNMRDSQTKLTQKIQAIQKERANLIARLDEIQRRLNRFESELSRRDKYIMMTKEQGESYEVLNPAYEVLTSQIAVTEGEMDTVEGKLSFNFQRLERANSVNSRLLSHIDAVGSVISSIEERENRCVRLGEELAKVKTANIRKSTDALDKLKEIEQIIQRYLRVKMLYEEARSTDRGNVQIFPHSTTNVNITVDKTNIIQSQSIVQNKVEQTTIIAKEEIKKHQIKFDVYGRICEYEGRKYGGRYNSYEDRQKRTCLEESVFGRYEGIRGESKFIPSSRIAEGIKVIEILSKYGLDGIVYRNAEPDFEVCSEAIVKIKGMTEDRYINFPLADIECAKLWNLEGRDGRRDWTDRDVTRYRKANCLTWHEKCDTETMVLVRTEINDYFKHSGGCSECRMRDAKGNAGGGFDD